MTSLKLAATLPAADAITLFARGPQSGAQLLGQLGSTAATAKLSLALKTLPFAGKQAETVFLPGTIVGIDASIQVVGLGADVTHESIRRATGAAARALSGHGRWSIVVPEEHADAVGAIAEGALLGAYVVPNERTSKQPTPVRSITLVSATAADPVAKDAVKRSIVVSAAVNRTRDLANRPPNQLPPSEIAAFAKQLATSHELKVEVLDEKALAKAGYGGIVAVGQGSTNPPRLVRLTYRPRNPIAHLALVGKGISFDTGGISLKPPAEMHEMKADMSGAAAVINAIAAISELKVPVAVTAYAACAENMPDGGAQRPGDVVKSFGGKTVEVLNTDAEGRLVLMDALGRANLDKPDLIVDVATLTGACSIALGRRISGVLSPNTKLSNHVVDAATRSGEQMWPLPLPVDYREKLDSPVADLANIAEREGGTLYGGLFLQEFVAAPQRWVHLDIAPPAFNSKNAYDYTPKGGTGAAVRTLVTLAEDLAAGLLKL